MQTFEQLNDLIIDWAKARNIIEGATPEKQASKTLEECEELITAVAKLELIKALKIQSFGYAGYVTVNLKNEIKDAIGDIIVTLCIQAKMQGLDIIDCLDSAYDEIKDRKGEMRNGKFVKEADL